MEVISLRTPSLGDATYIIIHGESALVVDPQRDIGRFTDVLDARRVTLTHVLETHMHNDYISGGRDLARDRGADLVLPAASGAAFAFVAAYHREEIEGVAGLSIRPLHTPGHTPAHTSYVILLDGVEQAVFTGGSLLVGSAGRSDLLGGQYARQLARLQFGSLHRLAALPAETAVFPTHGEGSFCTSTGATGATTSTIGREKDENPLYQFDDVEAFVDSQLSGLVPYPSYYAHMGPANRQGPTAFIATPPPELTPTEVAAELQTGTVALDGRDRAAFAAAHIPGSLGIELGMSFAPWAGWLLEYNSPLVLVLDATADATMAATELARIGFTDVRGVLREVDAWIGEGRDVASYVTATYSEMLDTMGRKQGLQILDVRDPLEWESGHIAGSVHRYVPDLEAGLPEDLDTSRPVWVICQSGARASVAAGLVERLGAEPVVVTKGGVTDVLLAERLSEAG